MIARSAAALPNLFCKTRAHPRRTRDLTGLIARSRRPLRLENSPTEHLRHNGHSCQSNVNREVAIGDANSGFGQ